MLTVLAATDSINLRHFLFIIYFYCDFGTCARYQYCMTGLAAHATSPALRLIPPLPTSILMNFLQYLLLNILLLLNSLSLGNSHTTALTYLCFLALRRLLSVIFASHSCSFSDFQQSYPVHHPARPLRKLIHSS
jgi:hypothetical protein